MDSVRRKSNSSPEPINNDNEGENQSENHQIHPSPTKSVLNSTSPKTASQNDNQVFSVPNKIMEKHEGDVQQRENLEPEVMDVDQREEPKKWDEQDGSDSEEEKTFESRAPGAEQAKIQPKRRSDASPQKPTPCVAQKSPEATGNKTPIAPEEVMSARASRSQKRTHPVTGSPESPAAPESVATSTGVVFKPKRSKVSSVMPSEVTKTSRKSGATASITLQIEPVSMEITQKPSTSEDKSPKPKESKPNKKLSQRSSSRRSQNVMNDDKNDPDVLPEVEDSPSKARPPRRSCVKAYSPPKTTEPRKTPLEIIQKIISELPPSIPRGHIIPTGLQRIPFHLAPLLKSHEAFLDSLTPLSEEEKKTIPNKIPPSFKHIFSILKELKIQESSEFPAAVEPTEILKRRVLKVQQRTKCNKKRYPNGEPKVLEGEMYQVKVDEEPSALLPGTEEDRDEVIWSSDDVEAHFKKDEKKLNDFYETVDEQYLFSIWRQFESHIQPEIGLQHLHQNKFDIPMSLHTIDQRLKDLPQKMKAPCKAQAQMMRKYMFDQLKSMRRIQEMGMRNYHLGELITFKWNLERFFNDENTMNPVACNCLEPKCRPLDFEPRYGCSSCVKGQKRLSPDKLCLICQTYQNLTGFPRSGRNVVFDEEERQKIRLWSNMERTLQHSTSREEFEELTRRETTQRHLKLQLTREEVLMLNFGLLTVEDLEKQVADQLQPYTLPHLPQCQCQKSGSIPRLAPNLEKVDFTDEEAELFCRTLIANKGNIVESSEKLGVEVELVERFLTFGSTTRSRFWQKNKQLDGYAKFPPRQILPPINAPENIPDLN